MHTLFAYSWVVAFLSHCSFSQTISETYGNTQSPELTFTSVNIESLTPDNAGAELCHNARRVVQRDGCGDAYYLWEVSPFTSKTVTSSSSSSSSSGRISSSASRDEITPYFFVLLFFRSLHDTTQGFKRTEELVYPNACGDILPTGQRKKQTPFSD